MLRSPGKVARVLNERELVVNRGRAHGVIEGMILEVINDTAETILDPETGEAIGEVHVVKNYLEVTEVQEKMCIGATYISWRTPGGPYRPLAGLSGLFAQPRTEYDTLETDEETLGEVGDKSIKIGDTVRQARKLPKRD